MHGLGVGGGGGAAREQQRQRLFNRALDRPAQGPQLEGAFLDVLGQPGERFHAAVAEALAVHGLPVLQPRRVREEEAQASLRALGAEIGVVVAYGQILPRAVIDIPARGIVNVHGSLLPLYRGAAPIQWAIARG